MKTYKSPKQIENQKNEDLKSLQKTLKKCLNIWGRGYQPKENVEDTIGSLLYLECKKVIEETKS